MNGPAAARLYDEHVDAIHGYVARRVGPDLAGEVVWEVFQQALTPRHQETNGGTERGRLLAIATAVLRRYSTVEQERLSNWGNSGVAVTTSTVGDPLLGSTSAAGQALTASVMAAVAELEPADRDLLLLTAWEECSSSLTTEAVGLSQRSVRSRLAEVRKELKRRIIANEPELGAEVEG